jgi:release factor glutamine methyltransferase
MRYQELVNNGLNKLKDSKAINDLINYYLKITEEDKINNIIIQNKLINKFNKAINKLIKGEPIQYIIGSVNFYGYDFKVSKSTLIPRFETEELVNNTINFINEYFKLPINIIDIGTGSGAIGITLKKELEDVDVTITDISKRALSIASKNTIELNADVKIVQGDMLKPLLDEKTTYDVLICNPPYLKYDEEIMDIVKRNEPKKALYGGKDGLKYYKEILKNVSKIMKNKFLIAFEIGDKQAKEIGTLINKYLPNCTYKIKNDLQERNRMLFIFNNIID